VQLVDTTACVDEAATDGATNDVGPSLSTSPLILEPVRDAIEDSGDDILNLLREVVDKTKIIANLAGETAEVSVPPPAQREWQILNVL
jgi:hypothetical protein